MSSSTTPVKMSWADYDVDEYEDPVDVVTEQLPEVQEPYETPNNYNAKQFQDTIIVFSDTYDYPSPSYRAVVQTEKQLIAFVKSKRFKWFHGYNLNNQSIIYHQGKCNYKTFTKYAEAPYIKTIENHLKTIYPSVYDQYILKTVKPLIIKKSIKKQITTPSNIFDLLDS